MFVVDHHVDSGSYSATLREKECRFIGSACSLVALMIQKERKYFEEDLAKSSEPNLAYLLAAAITLDTYYFLEEIRDKKWIEDDIVAHKFLSEFADVGQKYWQELNDIKFDSKAALALGLRAMFIRDYKKYDLKKGVMGISVITAQVSELFENYGEDQLEAECFKMLHDYNLGIFSIIGIHATTEGHVQKSIFFFIDKKSANPLALTFLEMLAHIEGVQEMKL